MQAFHQEFHEKPDFGHVKIFGRKARGEFEATAFLLENLVERGLSFVAGVAGLDQRPLSQGETGGTLRQLGDGQDAGFVIDVQGLKECFRRDLLKFADHAGGVVIRANPVGIGEPLGEQAGEVVLEAWVFLEKSLEVFMPDVQKLAIGTCLYCCADVFVADQAHFAKYLASLEAGNGDAGIVEDVNLPADDYIKKTARIAFAQNDFAFCAITKFEIFDHIAEIGLIDVAKKGKIAQEVDDAPHLVTHRIGIVLDLHRPEVFKTDGARTAGTGNHAVGDLIGPFVFDDDFGQIAVENFAGTAGGG